MNDRQRAADPAPGFRAATAALREADWTVAPAGAGEPGATLELAGLDGAAGAREQVDAAAQPPGTIVVTVDTLPAAFELEEILYELRECPVTLRASPFGYLFSFIRTFADAPECVLPDRRDITPATPCVDAYLRHLEAVAGKRGAPLTDAPARIRQLFEDERPVEAADLLQVPRGRITVSGMRAALDAALGFLAGDAAVARIDAEFARAQLWQWVRHETGVLDTGRIIGTGLFSELLAEAVERLGGGDAAGLAAAAKRLEALTTASVLAAAIDAEGDTDRA